MKIAIGCDHIVTDVKNDVKKQLEEIGIEVIDKGTFDKERTHYPIYGHKVGMSVSKGEADLGVCICGTGVGISNAAQKTKGIRTALVRDVITAIKAKEELNANVISCGGRITGAGLIGEIVKEFIKAEYKPTKENQDLIKKIDSLITSDNYEEDIFSVEEDRWSCGYYHD